MYERQTCGLSLDFYSASNSWKNTANKLQLVITKLKASYAFNTIVKIMVEFSNDCFLDLSTYTISCIDMADY